MSEAQPRTRNTTRDPVRPSSSNLPTDSNKSWVGAPHQDVSGARAGHHPRRCMHRHSTRVPGNEHHFPGMATHADTEPDLCFVEGEWPMFSPPEAFRGVRIEGTRSIKTLIARGARFDTEAIERIYHVLESAFPAKYTDRSPAPGQVPRQSSERRAQGPTSKCAIIVHTRV